MSKSDNPKENSSVEKKQSVQNASGQGQPKRSPLKWFKDARSEFRKVTWPTPKQVVKNTSVVLTILVIAGISVWGLDKLLTLLFGLMVTK